MNQNIFFSQQDADHVAGGGGGGGIARARSCPGIETRASSVIIFFIFVDCQKQRIISVYEDTNVHYVKQSVAC